jgi:hypothetical protein
MKSFTSHGFRKMYSNLPNGVQLRAKGAYQLFRQNRSHPGLNFKKVDEENNIYSVRVGLGYRTLGRLDGEDIVWSWIGSHAEYDKLPDSSSRVRRSITLQYRVSVRAAR